MREIVNREAYFKYFVEKDTLEAGIVLTGTEVKSAHKGKIDLSDAFITIRGGEIFLHNMNIPVYETGSYNNHEPKRARKLLLHRSEINKLEGKIREKGFTLIPLKVYKNRNKIKILIGLVKGKKLHDKRETIKQRDIERDMRRGNI